jgi:hypothetical protein
VRTVIIAISILVIVSFVLEDGYGQMPPGFGTPQQFPPGYGPPDQQPQQRKRRSSREKVKPADPNVVIDPNMPTDPNVILEKIQEFKGLDRDIKQATAGARTESREWTRPNKETNLELARAVNDQVIEEFKFIRELAAEEGAAMTVAAIDGLMLERQERFEQVTKKLEQDQERAQKKAEREERRRGGTERGGRTRDRDSRRRDRTRRTTPGTAPGMGMPPGM